MYRSVPEFIYHLEIVHRQIHNCRVAVVKVGAWELFEVGPDHLRLAFFLIRIHSRNRSKMNVRIDEAWNKKLPFPGNHRRTGRLLRPFFPLYADDAAVFDEHAALPDVIELLRRDNGDVRDPGSASHLARGGISNGHN